MSELDKLNELISKYPYHAKEQVEKHFEELRIETDKKLKECKLLTHCAEKYGKCGFKGEEAECHLNPDSNGWR